MQCNDLFKGQAKRLCYALLSHIIEFVHVFFSGGEFPLSALYVEGLVSRIAFNSHTWQMFKCAFLVMLVKSH